MSHFDAHYWRKHSETQTKLINFIMICLIIHCSISNMKLSLRILLNDELTNDVDKMATVDVHLTNLSATSPLFDPDSRNA